MARTTLNIDSDVHKSTRDVKDEYDDSWTDVLRFYREHRSELSLSDGDTTEREQTIDVEDAQVLSRVLEERLAPWFEDTQDAVKEATDAAQSNGRTLEELR